MPPSGAARLLKRPAGRKAKRRAAPAEPAEQAGRAGGAGSSSAGKAKGGAAAASGKGCFGHVISLGSLCVTARFLEDQLVRAYKGPFDWLYSSPRMIRHVLEDNFRKYLAPDQHYSREPARGTGHRMYGKMSLTNTDCLWPHHKLCDASGEDRSSFARAVTRFKAACADKAHRKLFVICLNVTSQKALDKVRVAGPARLSADEGVPFPEEPGMHLGSIEEIRRLFADLASHVSGRFMVEAVLLVAPPASEAGRQPIARQVHSETSRSGVLRISELHCKGPNTGVVFKENADECALQKLLIKGKDFNLIHVDDSKPVGMSDDVRKRGHRGAQGSKATAGHKRKSSARSASAHERSLTTVGGLERKLKYQEENPKKGMAGERYEKYKKARTVREFLAAGGLPADLRFDSARGWVKLLK